MKVSVYRYLILCTVVLAYSCRKQEPAAKTNILSGKLKSIEFSDSLNNRHILIDLTYDSSDQKLTRISWDNHPYIEISKKTNNYVILSLCDYLQDSCSLVFYVKAFIDNRDRITQLTLVDSSGNFIRDISSFYTTNDIIDSIQVPYTGISYNTLYYNLNPGVNLEMLQHKYSLLYAGESTDTIQFEFYSYLNTNMVPYQFYPPSFLPNFSIAMDPLYVLGLNGYFPCKPNYNLLKRFGMKGFDPANPVADFYYTIANDNSISRLQIRYPYYNTETFNFEYY